MIDGSMKETKNKIYYDIVDGDDLKKLIHGINGIDVKANNLYLIKVEMKLVTKDLIMKYLK